MIRKLALLPLIVLFISCTVTKRVHRPGYHIQWRKIERTQASEKIAPQKYEARASTSTKEIFPEVEATIPIENSQAEVNADSKISLIDSIVPVERNFLEKQSFVKDKSIFTALLKTPKTVTKSKSRQSARPIFWRMSPKSLRNLGIFFICLGGMILIGSMLVSFGAFSGNGTGGAWLNFFFDLINISGWFWLLFFILAFILIAYLFFLLVTYVLGGPVIGAFVGLGLLAIGIFLFVLGKRRQVE